MVGALAGSLFILSRRALGLTQNRSEMPVLQPLHTSRGWGQNLLRGRDRTPRMAKKLKR